MRESRYKTNEIFPIILTVIKQLRIFDLYKRYFVALEKDSCKIVVHTSNVTLYKNNFKKNLPNYFEGTKIYKTRLSETLCDNGVVYIPIMLIIY